MRWNNGWMGCVAVALYASTLGCSSPSRQVYVSSEPAGASILIDGVDSGQTTPAEVTLSTREPTYVIKLARSGYNPVERTVRLGTDVDVMDPDEVAGRICLAPCCLGLPLLGLLKPLRVNKDFVPDRIHASLLPEGQGLKVRMEPQDAEIYVDGRLVRPLDDYFLILEPGDREVEVQKEGYRTYTRVVHVDPGLYQDLDVALEIEGQGLVLSVLPEGAKIYVNEQFRGTAGAGEKRIASQPGPVSLQVELDGYEPWTDVITVNPDEYLRLSLSLELSGQGVLFHKPQGIRKGQAEVQILVDGAIAGTSFEVAIPLTPGEHLVRIVVPGFDDWESRVLVREGQYLELTPTMRR